MATLWEWDGESGTNYGIATDDSGQAHVCVSNFPGCVEYEDPISDASLRRLRDALCERLGLPNWAAAGLEGVLTERDEARAVVAALLEKPVDEDEARTAVQQLGIDVTAFAERLRAQVAKGGDEEGEP